MHDYDDYGRRHYPPPPGGLPYHHHYDPYYTYHYYENLRMTNPQAYAQWYAKYMAAAAVASSAPGSASPSGRAYPEDRASVHSGRSSTNEDR